MTAYGQDLMAADKWESHFQSVSFDGDVAPRSTVRRWQGRRKARGASIASDAVTSENGQRFGRSPNDSRLIVGRQQESRASSTGGGSGRGYFAVQPSLRP